MCTLESHKGFVCTVTLRAMCDIALFFDGFAPKPLRKINVYSCSKQRLWTSKDRQWTLQQRLKKVHEQVIAKTDFLSHVGTTLYLFYFLAGWF